MAEKRAKPDFSGWATRNNLECTDGRTILAGAFKHQDKARVPLVYQHDHQDPSNILGHADLENRAFGVYMYGYFNETSKGQDAKEAVRHGDISSLSIFANKLKQRGGDVMHGNIVEVSLVMTGANPGAFIDNVSISHADGSPFEESEAIITTGLTLEHEDRSSEEGEIVAEETVTETNTDDGKTIQDIVDGMSEEERNAMYYLIGEAVEQAEKGDDAEADSDEVEHSMSMDDVLAHIDGTIKKGIQEMGRNTFETLGKAETTTEGVLSHSAFGEIVEQARKSGASSLNDTLAHAGGETYGIKDIEMLFPDAQQLNATPDYIARRMEWVDVVLKGTKHSPFAKVKTVHADITEKEARAKGYITGKLKKEEVFKLLKRTTGPTTVYKKQKLDRDDILDITGFDVVAWLRQEMRLMLEEEIARAILVGDGRSASDDDKIKDPEGANSGDGIRSIYHDHELYAHKVELAANVGPKDMVRALVRNRRHYKGSGRPTLFISDTALVEIMLLENKFEQPLYATQQALADVLRVDKIVEVEIFDEYPGLVAEMVNLNDYTVGANNGGQITDFDDFDIDFNQYKYLSETRISGGLTKPKSALVITRAQGTAVAATAPSFDGATNTITVPSKTGVVYTVNDEPVSSGPLVIDEDTLVEAEPAEGYYLESGSTRSWTFTFTG